jgi:hypothetical protein
VFLLVVLSADRYVAVCKPILSQKRRTFKNAVIVCLGDINGEGTLTQNWLISGLIQINKIQLSHPGPVPSSGMARA